MFSERVFNVTLLIVNPISFCVNKMNNIMIELKNQYENKCFQGTYIINIINIVQTSSCKIINTNASAQATIDVKFLASIFILDEWEILIGSKIDKNNSIIICVYNNYGMNIITTFKPTTINSHLFTINQYIPLRIIKARHKPKTNQIATIGILLTCDTKAEVYYVEGEINKNYMFEMIRLLDKIKLELQRRDDIYSKNKDRILFFEKLLYSYKDIKSSPEIYNIVDQITYTNYAVKFDNPLLNIFNIFDKNLTGYWYRPLSMFRSCPYIIHKLSYEGNYISIPPHTMVIEFLKQIYSFLHTISDMTELYNTDELINTHENIWLMMRLKQI